MGKHSVSTLRFTSGYLTLFMILFILSPELSAQNNDERGIYFSKKHYSGIEIPTYSASKEKLPHPVMTENADWIDMYFKCWELAFQHYRNPPAGSPFVSDILDEAFNANIFQWDMIFMTMFARYAHEIFPAVNSLDNFYCRQHSSGYICREISEKTGEDFVFMGREHTINPPLFSWAEIESFKNTGDASRFKMVFPVLEKYVEWLNRDGEPALAGDSVNWHNYGRKSTKSVHHLYWNTGLGSGMDNTPRGGNGWVDMSCQMIIQYENLAEMSAILGEIRKEEFFRTEANKIKNRINKYCWDEVDGFYYDIDSAGNHVKWKTAGSFWTLLAGVASREQAMRLAGHLEDSTTFLRKNVFPTLAADQNGYDPNGGYWLGAVWAPTNYVIIKGLEKYGYEDFAAESAERYLSEMYKVYRNTGTVWENYSAEFSEPGVPAKPDFVGWTGIGPIALLIENILGFRVNAYENKLLWRITRKDRHGIKNLMIGNNSINVICKERESFEQSPVLNVTTNAAFRLVVVNNDKVTEYNLLPGTHTLIVKP